MLELTPTINLNPAEYANMKDSLILYHYDQSPYSEKIRLMFGLTNAHWYSSQVPVQPPRPSLDPLTGGYRRIPVAQSGADIFCDTFIIAQEVAMKMHCPAVDPRTMDMAATALMQQAEQKVFFAAIGSIPPARLIVTMIKLLGPIGTYRFAKDRASLMEGGKTRAPQGAKARSILSSFLTALETRLEENLWAAGETASVADFAIYHPLWLHVASNRRPLEAGPKVTAWYQRVSEIGHGRREEITQDMAFDAARHAEPRPLPTSVDDVPVKIGALVKVAPEDYGVSPVSGILAAVTEDRIILARDTVEFGKVHVHFPRAGYSIVAV
jgi:glutathione S-transferase